MAFVSIVYEANIPNIMKAPQRGIDFWLMQKLHDDLAGASPGAQMRTRDVFRSCGLEPWLDLRTVRRVERVNNLEVWGPEET